MIRNLFIELEPLPKKKILYVAERLTANAKEDKNHRHRKRDRNKIKIDEKFAKHHMHSKIAEDNLTDSNMKKEVCNPEVSEDIQVNAKEQVQIKSEYPKSITDDKMEYPINDAYIEIKQEVPCEDFDENHSMSNQFYHNTVSEGILTNIDIKKEVCYEEVNEDIQLNANEQLQTKSEHAQSPITDEQIEYQCDNIQDEMMAENKVGNNTTDPYFVNENEKSKLLVPEIKVSNVYDHVLEINPLEYNNFRDGQSMPEQVDEKFAKHHMQSKIAEDNLTDINIKKEVCHPEVNEDIQVNAKEQVQIKSEYPKSITDEQMEYPINDAHTEIKHEVPCEDFDENQSISNQFYNNTVSEGNLTNIDIKKEVCNEEVNEDIQLNTNKQLQIKTEHAQSPITDEQIEYQCDNIQDEMMVENNTTDLYFVNENEKSKLLVPEIKVSNVYDHVLEINPLEYNRQSSPEQDEIEQEVPCEYINLGDNRSINALNNDTYLQEDLRTKLEENENTSDSQPIPPCAKTLPLRGNRGRRNKKTRDSSRDSTPIDPPKSRAQKQREYRQRIAASRTPEQVIAVRKLNAERQRICRQRKAANSALASGSLESSSCSCSGAR